MFGLPTWAWQWIGYAVLALAIFGGGVYAGIRWEEGALAKCQAAQQVAHAQVAAVTAATAQISKNDQAAETTAQAGLSAATKTIIQKVPQYVSSAPNPPVGCITYGMLRLHDAAVLGVDPGELVPPAGEPDDACSTTSPADFMAALAGNYGAANQNAEQLNALEADVTARAAAVAAVSKKD